jgi:rhombotail lipoprotein
MKKLLLRFRPVALLALAAASILLISGCTSYFPRNRAHQSGSVVSFLFPKEQPRVQTPVLPVLDLPLRVGIAFVPETQTSRASFSEMQKQRLLGRVADKFRTLPFVQAIEVVPAAYLRPGGGFENLDQLRSLLGIDVIVLLSYDQVQFTDHNVLSLAYWTIVGAYVFTGDHNDTQTLMEATVYDIASRSFLFRAPGVDRTKGLGALAYQQQQLRKASSESLDKATADLTKNLDTALAQFQQTVKEGRTNVKITHKPGYTGGALDRQTANLMLIVAIAAASLYARRHLRGQRPATRATPHRDHSIPADEA